MRASQRMLTIQDPVIPVIRELIRTHPGTLSLGQGVSSFGPPPRALERARDFGKASDDHKYTPVQGLEPLLELMTRKVETENGITYGSGRRLVVTAGGNMAFLNAVFAITDPGDEVILPLPFYFNQEMALRMLNCQPVPVPTDEHHQLDLDRIESAITARTRAVVTISPNNPTGAVYPEEQLRWINRLCKDRGIYHISDEAYENFVFDGASHFSPASVQDSEDHTISLFSLSKAYGFASWRIGYMVIPSHLFSSVLKAQDTNLICPSAISQHAAMGALEAGSRYCLEQLPALRSVRSIVLEELRDLEGLCDIPAAKGAFYVFLRLRQPLDAMTIAARLIREHHVAVIPGNAFGVMDACTLRISYGALTEASAREGTQRLVRGLQTILGEGL
jgi:aspartate/methionine/tyrosine aminotransferase